MELAVTDDLCLGRAHLLKCCKSLVSFTFLVNAKACIKDYDSKDDDNVDPLFESAAALKGHVCRKCCRSDKDYYHRVCELLQESLPERDLLLFTKRVRTVLGIS